jgi:hypothetical protein
MGNGDVPFWALALSHPLGDSAQAAIVHLQASQNNQ